MKKLIKLAVATAVVFGASAFAEDNNINNNTNAAVILTDSQQCNFNVFDNPWGISMQGESVHVVQNKNMTKAVCQLDDGEGEPSYPVEKIEIPIGMCWIYGVGITAQTAQKAVVIIPSAFDHSEYGTMPTLECTYRAKDVIIVD